MKVSQLMPSVRAEVEKPFQKKLARAKELVHRFAGLAKEKGCVSCSFGKDSMVVLWLCRQEFPNIAVIFNNTGIEFQETIKFKEQITTEWHLNLIETKSDKTYWQCWEGFKPHDGSKTTKGRAMDRCCYYLKEKPFKQVVKKHGFTHNFTGLTAIESRQRMLRMCQLGQYYFNKTNNVWRIHPIAFWTPEEVWDFTYRVQIPVNPTYEKYGLDRIGCLPCTAHKGWRAQLARINPKMYKFIQEKYFGQKVFVGGFEPLAIQSGVGDKTK